MVIAFQIFLLLLMSLSVLGVIGERENTSIRDAMLTVFFASLAAYIVSVMWL